MSELNEIFITLSGVGQAMAKSNLEVPAYQRPYAWEDKHVLDLFQDLRLAVGSGEKEYFLGSIVVIEKGTGRLQVVDGQ